MSPLYVVSSMIPLLPIAGVIAAGLILVSRNRARLGRRSVRLANLGLGVLAAELVLSLLWSLVIPQFGRSLGMASFGLFSAVVNIILVVFTAGGVALLLGALLTRSPDGPGLADRQPGGFLGSPQRPGDPYRGPGSL